MRHKQYRPDLVVIDDIENLTMIRTKEQRDKTYKWLLGDVLPMGDKNTRYLLIGNLLHSDAIMNKIRAEIQDGRRVGIVMEFPFFDKDGKPLWAEKFSTQKDIDIEKKKYDERTWQREFLLKIVPEEGQEVKDEWIKHYEDKDLPPANAIEFLGTGVDLAISLKQTADYTAMVSGKLARVDGNPKIYVMPHPVNERLTGYETIEKAKAVSLALGNNVLTPLWVEDVAYQRKAIEDMERMMLPATGVKVSTDKRARLRQVAVYIQNGTVLFPTKGCEDLITQLLGFGIEAHDDLVDAFCFMISELANRLAQEPRITII